MKILIADDDPISLLYLQDTLQDWGYEVVTARDGDAACKTLLEPGAPTIAILDWMMPGMDGIDICRSLRSMGGTRYTYLIMLTSNDTAEDLIEAMHAGADDFIAKPFDPDQLEARISAGKRIAELETRLREKTKIDGPAGMYNRDAIIDLLRNELSRKQRSRLPVSLLLASVGPVQAEGVTAEQMLLQETGLRIARILRPYDVLGAYTANQALVVLPDCDLISAREVAERTRAVMTDRPVVTFSASIQLTASIGVLTVPADAVWSVDDVLRRIELALADAIAAGPNAIRTA